MNEILNQIHNEIAYFSVFELQLLKDEMKNYHIDDCKLGEKILLVGDYCIYEKEIKLELEHDKKAYNIARD